jgi:aminopeptidase
VSSASFLGMTDRVARLAEITVDLGANVQPGQIVAITAPTGAAELVRAVAERAYMRGARFVDPWIFDPYVKRTRIEHAAEDTLGFIPPWYEDRLLELSESHGARISLNPPVPSGVLDGVDPVRAGKDPLPSVKSTFTVINSRQTNWVVVPCPTVEWARAVHPGVADEDAVERLWEQVLHVCRLDEPDPVAAWNRRFDELERARDRLTGLRFDALHFEGGGTDLTVGLLPGSLWMSARMETVDGVVHAPNIPTEETSTAPDPMRVDGIVRATKPLNLDGTVVSGIRVRFEGGRAVEIEADQNAEALRGRCATDEGAARLGEVALVDRESRIGALDTVFSNTLLDENAASHLAFGNAYAISAEDAYRDRINQSAIHIDFMIGGDDVAVTGVARDGSRVPVLRGGVWQI